MIRRPPRSTPLYSSAASDVYKRQLDRPVSGVMLYARTSKALSRLNEMFKMKQVKKIYLVIVKERPPEDEATITHFLKKNETQNKTYVYDNEVKGSKEASLTYRLKGRSEKYYLLEVELHSGRHHQILSLIHISEAADE